MLNIVGLRLTFHKQFHSKRRVYIHTKFNNNPDSISLWEVAKTCLAATRVAVSSFYRDGPLRKDWNLSYQATRFALKAFMKAMMETGGDPFVHTIQRLTIQPIPTSSELKIVSEPQSFLPDTEVIEFIKTKAPADWPDVADERPPVYGEWLTVSDSNPDTIVYLLHGGAYMSGSIQFHRRLGLSIAKNAKCSVYGINYRLAPQNPYPCALIDAISGYKFLLEKYESKKIIIAGDSAGGGLSIATTIALRNMGVPLPGGVFAISPWIDVSGTFTDHQSDHDFDFLPNILPDSRIGDRVQYYIPNQFAKIPYVSPYWQEDFENLPPLLIQYGGVEKLKDEIEEFVKKVNGKWPHVTAEIYQDHIHDFQLFDFMKGSTIAIQRAGDWINYVTNNDLTKSNHPQTQYLMDFNGNELSANENRD
ncbi:Alpha/Beta hydrolase protein [Globomyces pollinis-pini]|nr:Alpha/Beta hydrolase protein [Globomyces pollinis-pini]